MFLLLAPAVAARAQPDPRAEEPAAQRADQQKLPEPENVSLTTDDGVQLGATYFRSLAGKNAAAIILLHMQGRDRRDWHTFALELQKNRYAVLTLDLRGHGDSTTMQGAPRPLEPETLRTRDYLRMAHVKLNNDFTRSGGDMETARDFLLGRHKAGELNLGKLGLVGAEMSAGVAMLWAAQDWSMPEETGTGRLLGQDVKAIALLSPEWNYRGLDIRRALRQPALRTEVAMLFAVGEKDTKARIATERMYRLVQATNEANTFVRQYDTSLAGTKMLGKDLELEEDLLAFFRLKLAESTVPWDDRRTVFEKMQ